MRNRCLGFVIVVIVFFFKFVKKVKLEYVSVLLCFHFQTALALEGLITLHHKRMLFTEGGKVVYFRSSSLKGRGVGLDSLPSCLVGLSLALYRAFVPLGKTDFKVLIQTLLLSFACILVSKTLEKTIWLDPVLTLMPVVIGGFRAVLKW